MADCKNCSAPLPEAKLVCTYCGTRNDVDLQGVHEYTVDVPESDRICPRCDKLLRTIDLNIEGRFLIEQCDECVGMFFDPGELDAVLDKSVKNVYAVDHKQISLLANQQRHDEYGVGYIKCPVCQKLMNRVNFGHRSGVIVDQCREHGVWVDGGELRHLMEWTKSGGQILHEQAKDLRREDEVRQLAHTVRDQRSGTGGASNSGMLFGAHTQRHDSEDGLLGLLGRAVSNLFR